MAIELREIFELAQKVYRLYDESKLAEAEVLTLMIDRMQATLDDEHQRTVCRKYAAPCLIDIGTAAGDEDMVKRGTSYFREWIEKSGAKEQSAYDLYCLANGYFSSWQFGAKKSISQGLDAEEHRLARQYYRQAIRNLQPADHANRLACEIWTNYGNVLDSVGRSIEAIDAYDTALQINPHMGMALGNKGIAISNLAPLMHGHTHLYYLEAIRLLKKAFEQPLPQEARIGFTHKSAQLDDLLRAHGEMNPEEARNIEPISDFHRFLCEFCARHRLFLNPITLLGDEMRTYYGDPVFISVMYAQPNDLSKFDRYVTFLNEIKQDFVMGRFWLVQSQYVSDDVDAVDKGVSLFYPGDYSLHGIYIQLLKAAERQAVTVLDKIACFLSDYCKLSAVQMDRVNFRSLWGGNDKIPDSFNSYVCLPLIALFSLGRDTSRSGDWDFIYEQRHAIAHRFLAVHDLQSATQNSDGIIRVSLSDLLNNTILAFKIAKAAVMYLVSFVEYHELSEHRNSPGITQPVIGTPVDGVFRYSPE